MSFEAGGELTRCHKEKQCVASCEESSDQVENDYIDDEVQYFGDYVTDQQSPVLAPANKPNDVTGQQLQVLAPSSRQNDTAEIAFSQVRLRTKSMPAR